MRTEHLELEISSEVLSDLQHAVEEGEVASISDAVEQALREWRTQRAIDRIGIETIRKAWHEALEDDSPGEDANIVFARLRERYRSVSTPQS